ncbi:FosX/FosE/FosI family fosfomycin resistance hydrolase [Roseibium album]|uniref:Fosfomycin resistance protein FosX n=1 Tax=Roseibium album TaxID=311410 RepID=A0A0M6ZVY8_9HYPH|nr:FosX/FosE/FosI family fosfomycin resistance hydrolase [Roseibium album]CTQ58429.1 Fosfomycin resistance protein FosX [Roseibium album]CTQ66437.1 Fosfomycin resistance protein FosX [Roseibium album]CTQ71515.1 Fosfomycin resistance protein FosX [Roseibium album]
MSSGLSHITFIVSDLERMSQILTDVLDGREVYASGENTFSLSPEKFFLVGDIWIAIMQGTSLPERSYNHVAFKIQESEFETRLDAIGRLGLECKPPRHRTDGEGRSIYFYDHDNHLFELHTGTLEMRLENYSRILQKRRATQ